MSKRQHKKIENFFLEIFFVLIVEECKPHLNICTIQNDSKVFSSNMTLKVKNNGSIIYQTIYDNQMANHIVSPIHFIISANTNIEITFTNSTSTSRDVGVSCYGYYMEAM